MNIIGDLKNPEQFSSYVEDKFFGWLPANKIILHHTVNPLPSQWKGRATINNLKAFYENKGWTAGPHLFVAPDGIWLFSDMRKDGIHAGSGNYRSIGIEMVGNFNTKKPSGDVWYYTKCAIASLNKKLNLKPEDIKFHREYSATACPGNAITKDWVVSELKNFAMYPNGTFLKVAGSSELLYIWENTKYRIPDIETLKFYWGALNITFYQVTQYEANKLKDGKTLPSIKKL